MYLSALRRFYYIEKSISSVVRESCSIIMFYEHTRYKSWTIDGVLSLQAPSFRYMYQHFDLQIHPVLS